MFLAVSIAAARRIIFKPARYAIPPKYGKGHAADAIFLLGLIAVLMSSETCFEGKPGNDSDSAGYGEAGSAVLCPCRGY